MGLARETLYTLGVDGLLHTWPDFGTVTPPGGGTGGGPTARILTTSIADLTIALSGTSSTDSTAGASIQSYAWSFGDGATATGPSAQHTYAVAGTYPVRLTVTDNLGAINSTTLTVQVSAVNIPPVAALTLSVSGATVTADASASTDADGTIVAYGFAWGDGGADPASASPTGSHTYRLPGTYTVTVYVKDDAGAVTSAAQTVSVSATNAPPTAVISSLVANGMSVVADGSGSNDGDGSIFGYDWDWGDGSAHGSGMTANHTYAALGPWTVTLTVTDNLGATGQTTGQAVPFTPGPSAAFPLDGTVKPSASNTGVGKLRALNPTGVLSGTQTIGGSTVRQGYTINGNVSLSGTAQLLDCIVNGTISVTGGSPLIENCLIQGDGVTTYVDPTTGLGQSKWLVNTNASTLTTIRFCTIKGRVHSNGLNGVGLRNFLMEYTDISCVVDCVDLDGATIGSNGVDCNTTIRGCYLHDMTWYPGDPGHGVNGTAMSGGYTYTGPWSSSSSTPPGPVSSAHNDCIQFTSVCKTPHIYANTLVASWSSDPKVSSLPLPNMGGVPIYQQLSCFMISAGSKTSAVTNLDCHNNWFDGGDYCINAGGGAASSGTFKNNKFGRTMSPHGMTTAAPYSMVLGSGTWTHNGNVYEDDGTSITVR